MRKLILSVLVCISALLASNEELRSFVVNDASIEAFNAIPKFTDTSSIFNTIEGNIQCEYWNGETIEALFNDSLRKYGPFAQMINEACSYKELLDSFDVEELKQFIREKYRIMYDSSTVSKFLESMKNVVFADSMMMRDYVLSLFAASMGVCYDTSNTYLMVKNVAWGDEEITELFKNTYKDAFDSGMVERCVQGKNVPLKMHKFFEKRKKLKEKLENDCNQHRELARRYKYVNCTEERWRRATKKVESLYARFLQDIVDSVTRKEILFSDTLPVVWRGDGCGCSLRDDLNGNVFAFYPYWLTKEGGDTLDFSVVTRIGYYGIFADDKGKLRTPSGSSALGYFGKPGYSEFVNVAHKHDVKVDWVINKSDWTGFEGDTARLSQFFKTLIVELDSLVNVKNASLFSRLVDKVSFGRGDAGLRGDGVTLWFKNYPKDAASLRIFKDAFRELHRRLLASNEFAVLNMLMDLHDLVEKPDEPNDSVYVIEKKGIYSYQYFMGLLSDSSENKLPLSELTHDPKNFLIVINNEPVSRNKLAIYNDVNRRLSGNYRTAVLHAVVPLLWFDYRQWDQLEDDASYYNDAFYSIGVGPYGQMNDPLREDTLSNILLAKYEKEDGVHKRQGTVAAFICTHRWVFRLLNTLVYVLILALVICYFVICRLNAYFNEHLTRLVIIMVVPPFTTTVILSKFDPMFQDLAGTVGCWGSFLLVMIVFAIMLLQVRHSSDIPKRK